jgi:predicted DNA-binding transcriptional regulator YafY
LEATPEQTVDIFDSLYRLHRIHQLISQEATGTPEELAGRFQLQKRQIYNLLDKFRDQGAVIDYSDTKRTYYYVEDFEFDMKIGPVRKNY